MYTVTAPGNRWLLPVMSRTLHAAIKTKVAREKLNKGCHFVITDEEGYIVTALEQRNYLCGYYF
jgi:hypothetical protein